MTREELCAICSHDVDQICEKRKNCINSIDKLEISLYIIDTGKE